MNERDELRLKHIAEAAERIAEYLAGRRKEDFLGNRMLQDAVIRNLEIIGEACVNLTSEFRDSHPGLPWNQASAIRNRLVHGYFDVDLDVVWRTALESIPAFVLRIRGLLENRK